MAIGIGGVNERNVDYTRNYNFEAMKLRLFKP